VPRRRNASISQHTARSVAALAIARAADRFPDLGLDAPDLSPLSAADAALATAIHRTTLQRWLTLKHVVGHFVRGAIDRLEPKMQAVLLTGGAQLLLMDRLPAYAVVDEQVKLAKGIMRPRAGDMVNAVLRKVAHTVVASEPETPWSPGRGVLPLADGGTLRLSQPLMPVTDNPLLHLSVATSHPLALVESWHKAYGPAGAERLCLHGITEPPRIVAVEPGFDPAGAEEMSAWRGALGDEPGPPRFVVWRGTHEGLVSFLAGHAARRVQDPAAAAAVSATASLSPGSVLDLCAGRGTKTRQLAVLHPGARVVASDPDSDRRRDLTAVAAAHPSIEVYHPDDEGGAPGGRFDLVVLDVPCSNTGVLARRPGARYRFGGRSLRGLIELQRRIMATGVERTAPGGHVLYSTCSIDGRENREQVDQLLAHTGAAVVAEAMHLPGGAGETYHDGGYWALIRLQP